MAVGKLTKQEKSWIAYDVGNSAFVLLSTALIPVYFSSIATGSVVVAWGYAETIAALVIALTMPVLGSLADLRHMKKKFLVGTVGTGALACCALGLTTDAFPFLVIYVVASIMLNSSMVFYDALLVDATNVHLQKAPCWNRTSFRQICSLSPRRMVRCILCFESRSYAQKNRLSITNKRP